jgi:PII-like signaling protein
MKIQGEASMLRIFVSNTDKFKHNLVYEMVVYAARRYGLAGATVLKGSMGYGSSSVIHNIKFWEITEKLPVVVEIVDETDKIEKFTEKILPWFENSRHGCMITVEKAGIVLHKQGKKKAFFEI